MKGAMIFCFVFSCLVAGSFCLPVSQEDIEGDHQTHHEHIRVKRFTCDVLSFEAGSVKFNHAACAAHCIYLGKAGGWCDGQGVCNCRN